MKRISCIGLSLLFALVACNHRGSGYLTTADAQDAEYTLLIDSVEKVYDDARYHNFTDTLLRIALVYYNKGDKPRDFWMQARCHYLTGFLLFDENHRSEEATSHFMETLKTLDAHFDASQAPVGRLYGKTSIVLSRIAHNYSDKPCTLRFARYGLDCVTTVGDTAWMLRSMANLGLLYERFGKAGEGDSAYYYCEEGLRITDADRFPYETALLWNSLANSLRHSHQYDSALVCFDRAFALVDSTCLLYHKNALEKAFVHFQARDYETALAGLEVAFRSKDKNLRLQAAYGLADCYEKLGDTLNAMPYYALVKGQQERNVVVSNHNAEVMPMLNGYLDGKEPHKGGKWLLWLLVFLVAAAVFVVYHCVYRKRMAHEHEEIRRDLQAAHGALEEQARETLRVKVQAIYDDKRSNTLERILEAFNAAYPGALEKLKTSYPDLNETELDICVLSCFPFRMKEIADILDLRENTVSKYRTAVKKKTQTESFEVLWEPYLG